MREIKADVQTHLTQAEAAVNDLSNLPDFTKMKGERATALAIALDEKAQAAQEIVDAAATRLTELSANIETAQARLDQTGKDQLTKKERKELGEIMIADKTERTRLNEEQTEENDRAKKARDAAAEAREANDFHEAIPRGEHGK